MTLCCLMKQRATNFAISHPSFFLATHPSDKLNMLLHYYLSARSLGGSQAAALQSHLSSTQVQLRQVPSSGLFIACRKVWRQQTLTEQHQPRFIASAFLKREKKLLTVSKLNLCRKWTFPQLWFSVSNIHEPISSRKLIDKTWKF
jgi:hypothetical protein